MNRNGVGYSLAPLILLVVTACGGGSDGDSSANSTPLAITDSNAKSLTEEMLSSLSNIDELEGVDVLPLTSLFPESTPLHRVLARSADGLAGVPRSSQTVECTDGGSVTVTEFTEEQIELDSNNCTISNVIDGQQLDIRINGKATLTRQNPTAFPPRQDFPTHGSWDTESLSFNEMEQLQCTFEKFLIEMEGAENVSMTYDGSMLMKAGTNFTNSPIYSALSGTIKITVNRPSIDISLSKPTLESLSRIDNNGFEFTEIIYNTTYGSSTLGGAGGQVTVTTLQNLIYDELSEVPLVSAKLKISGAANSSVMVTIPGQASDVQLDIDSNGDGVTDKVLDLSWMELDVK